MCVFFNLTAIYEQKEDQTTHMHRCLLFLNMVKLLLVVLGPIEIIVSIPSEDFSIC